MVGTTCSRVTLNKLTVELCSLLADGERGVPNEQVDIQRNRIVATAALKKAEPLADRGTMNLQCLLVELVMYIQEFAWVCVGMFMCMCMTLCTLGVGGSCHCWCLFVILGTRMLFNIYL